jgi:hypothetical protein
MEDPGSLLADVQGHVGAEETQTYSRTGKQNINSVLVYLTTL